MKMIEKLETFLVLAECLSFTETAKRVYCSQPTISSHIRQLEEMFGISLVIRNKREIKLTPQGKILYEEAAKIVKLFEETKKKVTSCIDQEEELELSIIASHYLGVYVLSSLLPVFHNRFPTLKLQVITHNYKELRERLYKEEIHCAYMPIYEDQYINQNFQIEYLMEDEFMLIIPMNHRLSNRKVIYLRDLHKEKLLLPESKYVQKYILTKLEQGGVKVEPFYMSSFEVVKQSVKAGLGIALLPALSVVDQAKKGDFLVKSMKQLKIVRKNGFVVRKDYAPSSRDTAFLDLVKESFINKTMEPIL